MRAFRFKQWQSPAELEEVSVPEPGHGEVLIRIGGAGACHSDLHIMHEWTPDTMPQFASWELPFTLGHENAGWIEGGDTNGLDIGAPVVISPTWSCGRCRSCLQGATNYCDDLEAGASGGLGLNGGLAEFMVAPSNTMIPLTSLEPAEAAPLTDAGLTSYHAVKQVLPLLSPGTAVVVIGVGGLGHLAIEFLRELCGAKIIAVDMDEKALEMAAARGADVCLPSDESTHELILHETRGLGAMAILDFVGANATLAVANQSLRKMGRLVIVGIGGGTLPLNYMTWPQGSTVMTVLGGSTAELAEVVALAEAGKVKSRITRFPLSEVSSVYEKLHANEISGRAVLVP